MRALMVAVVITLLVGCSWAPEERESASRGVAAGTNQLARSVGDTARALENGGWTAAVVVGILGVIKSVSAGLSAAKKKRVAEVAEGVRKAAEPTGAP